MTRFDSSLLGRPTLEIRQGCISLRASRMSLVPSLRRRCNRLANHTTNARQSCHEAPTPTNGSPTTAETRIYEMSMPTSTTSRE